jgi:prepilin-type N-terminal cleavage/methylation domain-containing protein/prepilin-type processing-associated H-X9-DG protein
MTFLRPGRAGFSLIELLVVIAIIAILAAIIFPVMANARHKARQTQCISNLKNLGQAFKQYLQDNYGYFPPWCASHPNPMSPPNPQNNPADHVMTWDKALVMDYLQGKEETVICPSNPLPKSVMGPGADEGLCRSYAIARYTQRPRGTSFWGGYAEMIPNPAKTVLLFEKGANLPGSWGDALGENVRQSHSSKGRPGYSEAMFHFGGKNILFVDGNVRLEKKDQGAFAWDSGRTTPAGNQNLGPGVCEVWGPKDQGGDWPPLD